MPVDRSYEVRNRVKATLTDYAPLTNLVPATRIYGDMTPADVAFPFIRITTPSVVPYEATGYNGSTQRISIHAFDKGADSGDVRSIAKQIVEAMKTFTPSGFDEIENEWTETRVIRDNDEAQAFHSICEFNITAVQEGT